MYRVTLVCKGLSPDLFGEMKNNILQEFRKHSNIQTATSRGNKTVQTPLEKNSAC